MFHKKQFTQKSSQVNAVSLTDLNRTSLYATIQNKTFVSDLN